jgi:hypothetical protein
MKLDSPLSFTDKHLEQILRALPKNANPHRITLLPNILGEWAERDLPEYADCLGSPASKKASAKTFQKLISASNHLLDTLDTVTEFDWAIIAFAMGETGKDPATYNRIEFLTRKIEDHREFIHKLIKSITDAEKQFVSKPGRPRHNLAYFALMDIVAIFEWVTLRKAARRVDRIQGVETGPLYLFACSIWPTIFANGDDGLPATMKKWAKFRHAERSALIANMDLRHRSWRVFDK